MSKGPERWAVSECSRKREERTYHDAKGKANLYGMESSMRKEEKKEGIYELRTVARLLNSRLKEGTYPRDWSFLSSSSTSRPEVPYSRSDMLDVVRVRRKKSPKTSASNKKFRH